MPAGIFERSIASPVIASSWPISFSNRNQHLLISLEALPSNGDSIQAYRLYPCIAAAKWHAVIVRTKSAFLFVTTFSLDNFSKQLPVHSPSRDGNAVLSPPRFSPVDAAQGVYPLHPSLSLRPLPPAFLPYAGGLLVIFHHEVAPKKWIGFINSKA